MPIRNKVLVDISGPSSSCHHVVCSGFEFPCSSIWPGRTHSCCGITVCEGFVMLSPVCEVFFYGVSCMLWLCYVLLCRLGLCYAFLYVMALLYSSVWCSFVVHSCMLWLCYALFCSIWFVVWVDMHMSKKLGDECLPCFASCPFSGLISITCDLFSGYFWLNSLKCWKAIWNLLSLQIRKPSYKHFIPRYVHLKMSLLLPCNKMLKVRSQVC